MAATVKTSGNLNLNWSFLPLNIWLQWTTGVNALSLNNSCKIRFYQFSSLTVHFICQVYVISYITREPAAVTVYLDPSNKKTTTTKWNTVIDYINWTSVALVCHVTILTNIRYHFPILMNCFRRSLTDMLDRFFYIKLRRLSFICISGIILLVSLLLIKYLCFKLHLNLCLSFINAVNWIEFTGNFQIL